MLRRIAVMTLLAMVMCGSATAQTVDPWSKWTTTEKGLLQAKNSGIQEATGLHDQLCSIQVPDSKKTDCDQRLSKIISRRQEEGRILSAMIVSANTLPNDARDTMIPIVNQYFQKMNDDTTVMVKEFFDLYPRRQASSN